MLKRLFFIVVVCLFAASAMLAQTKLLRFPDVFGDRVVFTYGGDLWTTSVNGGTATRLTAHPGVAEDIAAEEDPIRAIPGLDQLPIA